ncbi:glycosyltransferase family 4 protein [Sulfurovum sp.]|uniref:glycosyltransferase family 4 protein n=1 Tax=Sulfurovum sp. TaxID=1969726 RepID=UPI0035665B07
MKVLIVNTSDVQGGAARAAYRLHKSLLVQNIDSKMLVQSKSSDDFTVETTSSTKMQKGLNKLRPMIDSIPVRFYKERTKTVFSPSWFGFGDVIDKINKINPDIVHLHWINDGMIKIEDLTRIKVPVVWSLHDNWAFTGGCHIKWECEKYKESCGACPRLGSTKENDLSRKIFKRKERTFSQMYNMTIVGLSSWLNECSKNSTLLKDKRHINLPNPINTDLYRPFHKERSRELWNLPKNKQLVLFGAKDATSNINKGFIELGESLHQLESNNIEFVVFGGTEPKDSQHFGFKTHYLGYLHDDISLVTLYSAVDVMVVPSLQENLSNVIMESLACGTPVVGFNVGGNSDMIEHKKTGYLAKPFESTDLTNGIEWVLNNPDYDELCQNAREKIVSTFDSIVVAKKYIELYKNLLND